MMQQKSKLLLLILFVTFNCIAQIDHVEPLNWWVGINDPNLKILIHGNKIGEATPFIDYAGVPIKKIFKAASDNYLFVDPVIAKKTNPGIFSINFKKAGETIFTCDYTLPERQKNAAKIKGFTSSDVIYLLVPHGFANGDYSNDVVPGMIENKSGRSFPGGGHCGDIKGIINNLDYIAGMGYSAIWPTPLLENNMAEYSYHGYSITIHYKVDPRFGTLADYKGLSKKARQKRVKIINDEVLNLTGTNYWWTNDLPFKDWLNNTDSFVVIHHRRTVNQNMYALKYDQDLMTNGWFAPTMPDMNGKNFCLAAYLIQSSIEWIETLQLGGIRQDTYGYSDKNFFKNWSCRIMDEYSNFSMVGEEWSLNSLITVYWQQGRINRDSYNNCLGSIMDFPLQAAPMDALKEPDDPNFSKGLPQLYEALSNDFVYADPNKILVVGDNHDMDRIFTQLNQDVDLAKMALTYLLTKRSIPQIFYGTEILMENSGQHKNDGLI